MELKNGNDTSKQELAFLKFTNGTWAHLTSAVEPKNVGEYIRVDFINLHSKDRDCDGA